MLNNVINALDIDDEKIFVHKIHEHLTGNFRGEAMTLAQRFEQKGIEKGMQKEKIIVASRMLEEGVEPVFIAKITGLALSEINTLKKEQK